jgi:SAM-dependent methyltransferase
VLELGSHGGFITEGLLSRWPALDVTVTDDDGALVQLARRRLSDRPVRFHEGALDTLNGSFDVVLSVARHHHLPHGYLRSVRRLMAPAGVYIVADEFCPEYCGGADRQRLAEAKELRMAGGYVLTSAADSMAFEQRGVVPEYARNLEQARRRALWRWYRFVADYAVELGYFDIAAAELRSASDDLVTGSDAEHKFSPAIVEREFELAGFARLSKRLVGPTDNPEHQSMFVYEYGVAPPPVAK